VDRCTLSSTVPCAHSSVLNSGVTSTFFDGDFALFEKEWQLVNPQTIATIVVLTNERGAVPEAKRFGVKDAETPARTLAFPRP